MTTRAGPGPTEPVGPNRGGDSAASRLRENVLEAPARGPGETSVGVAVVLLVMLAGAMVVAVVAYGRPFYDGPARAHRVIGYGLIRYDGAGPERWAYRYRRVRRQLELLRRRRALESARMRAMPARPAIRLVFGRYAGDALRVSSCETGGTYSTSSSNGQYLGIFQLGSHERATLRRRLDGARPNARRIRLFRRFGARLVAVVVQTMRRLPIWLAGGPIVSDVAYDLVTIALERPELDDELERAASCITLVELAQSLAERLDVDEADVLRAWAELKRAGVMA